MGKKMPRPKAPPKERDAGRPVLHPDRSVKTTARISERADNKLRTIAAELTAKHGFTVSIADAIEEAIQRY